MCNHDVSFLLESPLNSSLLSLDVFTQVCITLYVARFQEELRLNSPTVDKGSPRGFVLGSGH